MISDDKLYPMFSVLIPTYNRPEYLQKCIDSILSSDFKDYEIVLSDDCSPRIEEIASVVEPYLRKCSNISFFRQPQNLGWTENRNFLVGQARGKYVLLLGDDDMLLPSTLGRIKCYIDKRPGKHIYTFGFTVIDEDGNSVYSVSSPNELNIGLDNSRLARLLFLSNIIPFWIFHPFTMCYERILSEKIRYTKEAHIGDDLLFLIDCVRRGKQVFVIPEALFLWRKAQSLQGKYRNLSSDGLNNIIARRNILSRLKISDSLDTSLSDLASTFQFRKGFLYDPIIMNGYAKQELLRDLDLDADAVREIWRLESSCPRFLYGLRLRAQQIRDFWWLFGVKGMVCLLDRLREKFQYRLLKQFMSVSPHHSSQS